MKELRGKPVTDAITAEMKEKIGALQAQGVVPTLAIVRVGERPDDLAYERGAKKRFAAAGAAVRVCALPQGCAQPALEDAVRRLNEDPAVHGVLVLRPLPRPLDEQRIRQLLAPQKDVDGMTEASFAALLMGRGGFAPCTPRAVLELLAHYGIDPAGKKVTVVGRSLVVGKPLALLLLAENATVTVCHTRTADLPAECRAADILVACAGHAGLLGAAHVRPGQVVLDVGMNVGADGSLCGDVAYADVAPVVQAATPVPGGVGSVTTAVLLKHTVLACEAQRTLPPA